MTERIKGTLAEQIKLDRIKNNWTQDYLGKLIGSKDALLKYERGILLPTRERSKKLADIFNTGTTYYYDDYLEKTEHFKVILENSLIKSGLSVKGFCRRLGISHHSFYLWMQGKIPSRDTYEKIKELLK